MCCFSIFMYVFGIFQVELLQTSNKRDPNNIINDQRTTVDNNAIRFQYTDADYSKMIRAFIDAVTSNISLLSLSLSCPLYLFCIHINYFKTIYDLQPQVSYVSFAFLMFVKQFQTMITAYIDTVLLYKQNLPTLFHSYLFPVVIPKATQEDEISFLRKFRNSE